MGGLFSPRQSSQENSFLQEFISSTLHIKQNRRPQNAFMIIGISRFKFQVQKISNAKDRI